MDYEEDKCMALKMQGEIFQKKQNEATEEYRKLDNRKLKEFYTSTNAVDVIKSHKVRWDGHTAVMENRVRVY
jgi:hypothetical protein